MVLIELWRRRAAAACALALLAVPGCRDDVSTPDEDDPEAGTEDGGTGDDGDADGGSDDADGDGSDDGEDGEDPGLGYLDPVGHLVRVSMALRGSRPSVAEIEAVEADPDALPGIVDTYLDSEAFGEVVRDLHDDALHVGIEQKFPALEPLQDMLPILITKSAMQPPLRLAEHVVTNDLPYTELLTADYMLVDEVAATVWGRPYDSDGPEWQVATMDDRPAAGILAESSLFLRYESAGANYNRGRANAVSAALLCHDFQSLDIEVGEVNLSDPDAVNDAVVDLPECSGCHHTLDPLASTFFVHYPQLPNAAQLDPYPLPSAYIPGAADAWQNTNEREPGFFGVPTDGVEDLAHQIIEDPRFAQCAAMRFYGYFHQTPWQQVPADIRASLQETLVDSGWNAKAMVRQIVLADDFRIARGLDEASAEAVIGLKKARPFQMARLIEDLTGFVWEFDVSLVDPSAAGVIDLSRNATAGFKVLGGAGDSLTVLDTATTVNATTSLFVRQLATEAASYVVERDFAEGDPAQRALLTMVDDDETGEAEVRAQLAWLFLRLYAERVEADDADVDSAYAIFEAVAETASDPERAWKATLAAMLQDFSVVYY